MWQEICSRMNLIDDTSRVLRRLTKHLNTQIIKKGGVILCSPGGGGGGENHLYLRWYRSPRAIFSLLTGESVFSDVRKLSYIADEICCLTPDSGATATANITLAAREQHRWYQAVFQLWTNTSRYQPISETPPTPPNRLPASWRSCRWGRQGGGHIWTFWQASVLQPSLKLSRSSVKLSEPKVYLYWYVSVLMRGLGVHACMGGVSVTFIVLIL